MLYQDLSMNEVARAITKGEHVFTVRGHSANSAKNDLNQNSISFMHMPNAYLSYVANFKSLHEIL